MTFVDFVTPVPADWLNNVNRVVNSTATVASISALRLVNSTNATYVIVAGYTSPIDGGGGTYILNPTDHSSTDNGGTIIVGNDGGRWYLQYNDIVSVKQFGAVGNGVANDTTAIQRAITALQGNASALYFPTGTYNHTGLTITGAVQLIGAHRASTALFFNNTSGTGITVATPQAIKIADITFTQAASPTSGAALSLSGGGTNNNVNSVFRDCNFNANFIGIQTLQADTYVIDSCEFNAYISAGIVVQSIIVPDAGDSVITNCIFSGGVLTNNIGINQFSSGGLKILGNKIIGGGYGYLMQLAVGANTSDLLFLGNSVEGHAADAVALTRQGGSGTFANVVITGNQIAPLSGANSILIGDSTAGWLSGVSITGNNIDVVAATAIAIGAISVFNITGNTLLGQGGSPQGISVVAGASNGTIGPNTYNSLATPISNASVSTAVTQRTLPGSAVISCTTVDGALFTGATTVTLPTGFFQTTPIVTGSITSGNGVGVGATAASPTSLTLTATATTSGTVTIAYVANAPT